MILLGTAGTGKSFTINALSTYLGKHLKRAAPTAKAAFIIKGETLHSLLNIRVTKKSRATVDELKGRSFRLLLDKYLLKFNERFER